MVQDKKLKIIIIGAGLGGALLSHLLNRPGLSDKLDVTVYEKDEATESRNQGLTITLSQEAVDILSQLKLNISALFYENGPKDLAICEVDSVLLRGKGWMSVTMPETDSDTGNDGNLQKYSSVVERSALRNKLVCNLNNIVYGKKFLNYGEYEEGVTVYFSDGTTDSCDLLIGADGAYSKVRELRCKELVPKPLGLFRTGGSVPFELVKKENIGKIFVEETLNSMLLLNGKKGVSLIIVLYKTSEELRIMWALSMPTKIYEDYSDSQTNSNIIDVSAKIAYDLMSASSSNLILLSKEEDLLKPYSFSSVDVNTIEKNPLSGLANSRVTLVGDAAHKTTTHAGLGATAAFKDASILAESLLNVVKKNVDLISGIRKYEEEMSCFASKIVQKSLLNTKRINEDDPFKLFVSGYVLRAAGYILGLYDSIRGAFEVLGI